MVVFTILFFISQEHWNDDVTNIFRILAVAGFLGTFLNLCLTMLPLHWCFKKREESLYLHKKHFTWKGKEYAYREVRFTRYFIQANNGYPGLYFRETRTVIVRLKGPRWVIIGTPVFKDCEKEFEKPIKQFVSRLAAQNNRGKRELPTWSSYLWGICFIIFILLLLFDLVSAILGLA
ncbi:MAG: hypothetical protein HWD92_11970 [Flavobacteriia bacterium]|nr:hypothetical protein [Flavobacteriia bacterium]